MSNARVPWDRWPCALRGSEPQLAWHVTQARLSDRRPRWSFNRTSTCSWNWASVNSGSIVSLIHTLIRPRTSNKVAESRHKTHWFIKGLAEFFEVFRSRLPKGDRTCRVPSIKKEHLKAWWPHIDSGYKGYTVIPLLHCWHTIAMWCFLACLGTQPGVIKSEGNVTKTRWARPNSARFPVSTRWTCRHLSTPCKSCQKTESSNRLWGCFWQRPS